MKLWTIVVCVLVCFACSTANRVDATSNTTEPPTLKQTILDALGIFSSPELTATLAVMQQFHQTSSSTISSFIDRTGLDRLDANTESLTGYVDYSNVPALLANFRDSVHNRLADDARSTMRDVARFDLLYEAMKLSVTSTRPLDAFMYDIFFSTGNGGTYSYQHFTLVPSATNGNFSREEPQPVQYRMLFMHGTFSLAPNIMIVRRAEHSFFEDETWDELVYIGRALTAEDFRQMVPLLYPIFFGGL